jgi:hypothetical protein
VTSFALCPHGRTEPKFCIRCQPASSARNIAQELLPFLAGTLNNPEAGLSQDQLSGSTGIDKTRISGYGITWILNNAVDVAQWLRDQYGAGPGAVLCQDGKKYFFSTGEDEIRQYRYTIPLHRAYTTVILTLNGLEPYLRRLAHNSVRGREHARTIRHHLAGIIEVIQISQGEGVEEQD